MDNNKINPGAVIIDSHRHADLGVVRALGERGVPIYLLTSDPTSPVAISRYVTKVLPYPPPEATDDERVSALIEVGRRFKHRPVFFNTGDSSLLLFSRHRHLLEKYFHHHIGEADLIEALQDRVRFAQLAKAHGLAVPASAVPTSLGHLQASLPRLRFPVTVKAAKRRRWDVHPENYALTGGDFKSVRIGTAEQLLALYPAVSRYGEQLVIQDYIEGRDDEIWSLHAFIDRQGEVIGAFTGQRLRAWPIHGGVGCFHRSAYQPSVVEVGLRALREIGYTGHAVVQVKRVPGQDQFTILGINCRYSAWNHLPTRAGVNMPYAAYRDSLGEKQTPLPLQRQGVCWIDARSDRRALSAYRRRGEWRLRNWLRSYLGDNCYALFDRRDPLPALHSAVALVTCPLRWLRRHLPPVTTGAVQDQGA